MNDELEQMNDELEQRLHEIERRFQWVERAQELTFWLLLGLLLFSVIAIMVKVSL